MYDSKRASSDEYDNFDCLYSNKVLHISTASSWWCWWFRWWIWSQCLAKVVYRGRGSQTGQHPCCWSPSSCGAYCAASGVGDETLGPSSCGTTWRFSSGRPSSAGCRPRGRGSGSTWPCAPPSADWKTQARPWLWCSAWWHGSGGVVMKSWKVTEKT